jgi:hypothetical protein
MPCYDHRSSASYIQEHTVEPLEKRVNQYAGWLCDLLMRVPAEEIHTLPKGLQEWWKGHQDFDRKRKDG